MSPSWQDIANLAHAKWANNGRSGHTQLHDWLAAEAELQTRNGRAPTPTEPPGWLFRDIVDNGTALIHVKDVSGRFLFVNHRYETVFQRRREEVLGRTVHDLFPKGMADVLWDDDRQVLVANLPREFEEVVPQPDGLHTYISLKFPIADSAGRPYAVCGICTDVTARRQAERALHRRDEEFDLARQIQQGLLPAAEPAVEGFDIAGLSCPCQETGGDYFDFLPMPDGCLGVVIADVSGHGIGPAILIATTRAYLRAFAVSHGCVGRVVSLANRSLAEDMAGGHFVTLFLARLDPRSRSLVYTSAGHETGFVLGCDGRARVALPSTGIPLGVHADEEFAPAPAVTLAAGELLLLLTDGIADALSPEGARFSTRRALGVAQVHRQGCAADIARAVVEEVRGFCGGDQTDDFTVVVVKGRGSP